MTLDHSYMARKKKKMRIWRISSTIKVNQWIQCLALQIPQHNASHLTGTLITVPQEQGKLEIFNFKQRICSKVTNQCLIARIPQRKASHLTDIYFYHSTA